MAKYENLLLAGMVYRKKAPSDWEMNGTSGTSYHIILDCFESIQGIDSDTTVTLKVSQKIFDELEQGKKYIFNCTADISGNNSNLFVRSVMMPISLNNSYKIVPLIDEAARTRKSTE